MPTTPETRSRGLAVRAAGPGRSLRLGRPRRGQGAFGLTVFQLLITLLVISVIIAVVSVVTRREDDEARRLPLLRPWGEPSLVAPGSPRPATGTVKARAA